jgi:hypothetical protein
MDAARNTLQELLVLMDAQSAITDPSKKAMTIIDFIQKRSI